MAEPTLTVLLVLLAGYLFGLIGLFVFGFVIMGRAWGFARIERPRWLFGSDRRLLMFFFASGLFLLAWDFFARVVQAG